MKNRCFLFFLVLLLCAALLPGCSEAASTPNNLAEYAVEVKDDLIQPKGLDFDMSVEEVCKIKGLEISDQKFTRPTTSHIDRIISIDGLSDEVCETFHFYEGKLTGVEYTASVGESDFEALFAQVIAQAEALLPETMKSSDPRWIDSQGFGVDIGSAHGDENTNPDFICLSIRRIKSGRTTLQRAFPMFYDELKESIGKPMEAGLKVLDAADSGLTPDMFGAYSVPVKLNFHGVEFDTVGLGSYEGSLYSFVYYSTLTGSAESNATVVSDLALYLRETLERRTEEEVHSHPELDPSFKEEFSPENLTQWLSENAKNTNSSKTATWLFPDLTTESAKSLYDSMLASAKYEKEKYYENLALRMALKVTKLDDGTVSLVLSFKPYLIFNNEEMIKSLTENAPLTP